MYKSIMKKKRKKKHDKKVLLAKALIDSNIIHDEFVLINDVVKEYDDMKEETNNLKTS